MSSNKQYMELDKRCACLTLLRILIWTRTVRVDTFSDAVDLLYEGVRSSNPEVAT